MSGTRDEDFLNRRLTATGALQSLEAYPTTPFGRYRAAGGELLGDVARWYYGSQDPALVRLVAEANGIGTATALVAGVVLTLPAPAGRQRWP